METQREGGVFFVFKDVIIPTDGVVSNNSIHDQGVLVFEGLPIEENCI